MREGKRDSNSAPATDAAASASPKVPCREKTEIQASFQVCGGGDLQDCLGRASGHLGNGVHPAVFQVGRFMNGRQLYDARP
jgi:hypothetical protein